MKNRRSFLTTALQTSALALGGSRITSFAEAPKRQIRKAIMGGTLGIKGTLVEKYKAAREAGYEGVEPPAA